MTAHDPADEPLRIAIDGRNLLLSEGTGIATYGRALLEAHRRLGVAPELILDTAFTPLHRPASPPRHILVRRYLRALWLGLTRRPLATRPHQDPADPAVLRQFARVRIARDAFRTGNVHLDLFGRCLDVEGADPPALMHWTYPLPLRFRGVPNIYTVHDLIPLRDPTLTSIDQKRFARMIAQVVAAADHIVTVSESSRGDIIALLGCPPEKVTNTYQALDLPAEILRADDAHVEADIAATLGLPRGGYFLYAGAIEWRKNVRGLIEAHRAAGVTLPLVLAGPEGWRADEQLEPARDRMIMAPCHGAAPAPGAVVRLPYVSYTSLLNVMRGARALVFPSLSEGFGLPILEAMALGTPVVTSNVGALAEIAGDAALLVDVRDPRVLARALELIETDAGRCAELAERGRRRAAAFSLDVYTARMGRLYRDLIAANRPAVR